MSMMTSQFLKFVNFTKIQKSRYLENEKLFFLQIKKFINYTSLMAKNIFIVEVTFKIYLHISHLNHIGKHDTALTSSSTAFISIEA